FYISRIELSLSSSMRILVLISDRANPPLTPSRQRNFHLWAEVKKLGVNIRIAGIDKDPQARFTPGSPNVESEFLENRTAEPLVQVINRSLYSSHQGPLNQKLANRIEKIISDWKPDIIH